MEPLDLKKIAAEVSIQHGIRIDADDPIMAVVTLNRIVLEQSVADVLQRIQTAAEEFEKSAGRIQVRAGSALAQEVKDCTVALRKEIATAAASLVGGRVPLMSLLTQASTQWGAARVLAALIIFGAGIWVGTQPFFSQLAGR